MSASRKKILLKFLSYLKPYWIQELVTLLVIVVTSVAALSSPYFLKIIIDEVLPSGDYQWLINLLLIMVGINLGRIGLQLCSDYLYEWINNKIMRDLRMDLYSHIIRLPMSFFNDTSTGDIVYRVNNEVNKIQSILTGSLLRLIQSAVLIVGISVALCLLNWQLFLISITVIPILMINIRAFHPRIVKWTHEVRARESGVLNTLVDKIEQVKLIKSFGKYAYEVKYLSERIHNLINSNLKYQLVASSSKSISTFLVSISPLLILLIGGQQVMAETMTLGALIAFIQYLNRIFNPFRELMGLYVDITRASVSMRRLFDYFELEGENLGDRRASLTENSAAITFEKVVYFRGDAPVLRGLDLSLPAGKTYAIAGHSGCGKSTLLDLLCRFESPHEGSIYYGAANIAQLDLDHWRSRIALVSQENQLFNQSIAENLHYGEDNGTITQLDEAIALTGLSQKMDQMPDGYQSMVGERGAKFSGGQVQRLAISRALLKTDWEVLILDEATSALDSETEKLVIENILKRHADKTIILVSHRLSTIQCADHIICLDEGRVVEQGSYESLMEASGFFTKLFAEQITQPYERKTVAV